MSNPITRFIGQPGYGSPTPFASRGLYRACEDMRPVYLQYAEGSLLAANFNRLWAQALNLAHCKDDPQVDIKYFAMLHDDIGPEDFWLDKLIQEMEAHDLDILGVAAPIKDFRGMTSTALARDDGDPWEIHCRLSMTDVFRLPPTFTSDDVGRPLLLNTGCWVCRFDPAWAKKVHFTVNDRIVQLPDGSFKQQTEPEDWFFSRLLHELGLRVGCTSKIKLVHSGQHLFHNYRVWGKQAFDEENVDAPPFDNQRIGRPFAFPNDVQGWLSENEGEALNELASGKHVLEIGSYCGLSTICMAQSAKSVTAIDPFDGRGTPVPRNTRPEFDRNIERYGVADRITAFESISLTNGHKFDVAFIDGDHSYESVRTDIADALMRLEPDGVIAFHDYRRAPDEGGAGWDAGVTQAVEEFVEEGAQWLLRRGTVAVVKPSAEQLAMHNACAY